jgi:hypothetical protein
MIRRLSIFSLCLALAGYCTAVCPVSLAAQKQPQLRTRIPQFARVLDLQIGADSIGKLQRRIGKGCIAIGYHPNSRRVWRSKETGWNIHTDGFYYAEDDTPIVDSIRISHTKYYDGEVPSLSTPRSWMGWWKEMPLGIEKSQALRILRKKRLQPKVVNDTLTWSAKGKALLSPDIVYHQWAATLIFRNNRLVGLSVRCEEK